MGDGGVERPYRYRTDNHTPWRGLFPRLPKTDRAELAALQSTLDTPRRFSQFHIQDNSKSKLRGQQKGLFGCRFKVVGKFNSTPRGWPSEASTFSIT